MVDKLVAPVFIALWMALGWTLKLDPNQYLLLGTPLTVIFQLFVSPSAAGHVGEERSPRRP